jgi:hypothetical protein
LRFVVGMLLRTFPPYIATNAALLTDRPPSVTLKRFFTGLTAARTMSYLVGMFA